MISESQVLLLRLQWAVDDQWELKGHQIGHFVDLELQHLDCVLVAAQFML